MNIKIKYEFELLAFIYTEIAETSEILLGSAYKKKKITVVALI